jgi:hypothetical protein
MWLMCIAACGCCASRLLCIAAAVHAAVAMLDNWRCGCCASRHAAAVHRSMWLLCMQHVAAVHRGCCASRLLVHAAVAMLGNWRCGCYASRLQMFAAVVWGDLVGPGEYLPP